MEIITFQTTDEGTWHAALVQHIAIGETEKEALERLEKVIKEKERSDALSG